MTDQTPAPAPDRPLVTFALFAYNQEQYIREAVEGAFSQTYEPLEIILSDDCSSDRTFEIMQEMAAAYEGPHEVRVRRSVKNKGLIAHINDVSSEVSGEIVFVAAGDDVSLPNRLSDMVPIFLSSKETFAVFSDFSIIGRAEKKSGNSRITETCSLYEVALNGGGLGKGATYAYRKKCFDWPQQLNTELFSEDRILPMRAALLGRVVYFPEITILYREEETGMGRILRYSGRLSFSLRPHIETIIGEMRYAQRKRYISYFTFLKCSIAIKIRYLLSEGSTKEARYARVVTRATRRAALFLLRALTPSRKKLRVGTGEA